MFKKALFLYDCYGKIRPEPLELSASDVKANCFWVETATFRDRIEGEVPALFVVRDWKNLKTDPYNEDGRPPTLMTIVVLPRVDFDRHRVTIFGFERGNLCWAGQPVPEYRDRPPLKLPPERLWPLKPGYNEADRQYEGGRVRCGYDLTEMHRQKIVLVS